ncbi:hypothetical protein OAO18_01090 [Francisellaceae bacterium]|nr:hypothetical protein [Francisellaceae bacterium]
MIREARLAVGLTLLMSYSGFADLNLNPEICSGMNNFPQKEISKLYGTDREAFLKLLAETVKKNNNIGSMIIPFNNGKKTIYRSSLLYNSQQCLKALTKDKNVQTLINLYNGDFVNQEQATYGEENEFAQDGGWTYIKMLDFNDRYKNEVEFERLQKQVTSIAYMTAYAQGNVLLHCYGGIHRTGIVFGVLQKCIQKVPMAEVINTYKKHADWHSKEDPGVYYQINVDFIEKYDCHLLDSLR